MLLKALFRRLTRGADSSISNKTLSGQRFVATSVYEKYPNLADLVLSLLQDRSSTSEDAMLETQETTNHDTSASVRKIFPALEIIELAGVPSQHQLETRTLLHRHLASKSWYTREKAAKALSLVVNTEAYVREMNDILLQPWFSQNTLHGRLLYVRFMVLGSESRFLGVEHLVQGQSKSCPCSSYWLGA